MHRWIYLLVAGGGAAGSVARFWLSGIVGKRWGDNLPFGTIAVNILGCLAIGFFATVTSPDGRWFVRPEWRLAFMTGVCGGFTTFSAFSLQTLDLGLHVDLGEWRWAAGEWRSVYERVSLEDEHAVAVDHTPVRHRDKTPVRVFLEQVAVPLLA